MCACGVSGLRGEICGGGETLCGNEITCPVSLAEFSDIFKVENLHESVWEGRDRIMGTHLEEHRLLGEQNNNIGILGLTHLVRSSGKGQCYISHLYGGRGQWGSR